jgi:hypothetical protein
MSRLGNLQQRLQKRRTVQSKTLVLDGLPPNANVKQTVQNLTRLRTKHVQEAIMKKSVACMVFSYW